MKTTGQLIFIYEKYLLGQHSEAELQELLDHFYLHGEESPLMGLIAKQMAVDLKDAEVDAPVLNIIERVDIRIADELQKRRLKTVKSPILKRYAWVAAAASIVLIVSLYFYNHNLKSGKTPVFADIAPGKNTAILTLANGKTIHLSDAKTGVVIDATKLAYNDGTEISSGLEETLNGAAGITTLSTPNGGTYQIILSDGTKVWLNSASTIIFPAKFSNSTSRNVQLNGEAYFEVAKVFMSSLRGKQSRLPFLVTTKNQKVQVLGTHFNVNSYEDEPVTKTTLLEGAVAVSALQRGEVGLSLMLKPGEQAIGTGNSVTVRKVDTDAAVSWINGGFIFNEDDDLKSTMRKIARWYDVDIVYDASAPMEMEPRGWISRGSKLSALLQRIESTGKVHFKIEGRRVTVMR